MRRTSTIGSTTGRWIASQSFTCNIAAAAAAWRNRMGIDTYLDQRQRFKNERPWRTAQGLDLGRHGPAEDRDHADQQRSHADALVGPGISAAADRRAAWWAANINMQREQRPARARHGRKHSGLLQHLELHARRLVQGNLPTKRRLVGVYSQATVDYSDWAFLTLTGRNDWSSTLPTNNNSYFYPSASLGVVFTDALGWAATWLQYGKTASVVLQGGQRRAALPSEHALHRGRRRAARTTRMQQFNGPSLRFPFRGQNGFLQSDELGNPDLQPESTVEIGSAASSCAAGQPRAAGHLVLRQDELRPDLQRAVVGGDAATRRSRAMPATCATRALRSSVQATPVQTRNFYWDVRLNYLEATSRK